MFLIIWVLVIIYEVCFMNTKFGLNNFINEDSTLYLIIILAPMVIFTTFLGAFILSSNYKEITYTWKNNPKKIKDELKLLFIGAIFFLFLCIIYYVLNFKPM